MQNFHEFIEFKKNAMIAEDIIRHLCYQSQYFDPAETMQSIFSEQYGKNEEYRFVEAFDGQKGWWGNLGDTIKNTAKGIFGYGAAGVGGALGAAKQGLTGAVRGAMGQAPGDANLQKGAQSGSQWGKNIASQGFDASKASFGKNNQAAVVSAYNKSKSALDAFVQALQAMPDHVKTLGPELQKVKDSLETVSNSIDQAIKNPPAPVPVP